MKNNKTKLKELLKNLFRTEKSELDFGIYKVINQKTEVVNDFIENDLIENVEKQITKLDDVEDRGNMGNSIYNHIYNFFDRYYKDGDLIRNKRYSNKDTYKVPYNGEETYFHWATKEQYYVKTSETLYNYSFKAKKTNKDKKMIVNFKLSQSEESKNNNKSNNDTKYHLLSNDKSLEYDKEANKLNIYFEYRALKEEDNIKIKNNKNKKRDVRNKNFDDIKDIIEKEHKDLKFLIENNDANTDNERKSILYDNLYNYTIKNSSDFFVHKDLKGFLERELETYIKEEIINVDNLLSNINIDSDSRLNKDLNKAKTIKQISLSIIDMLADIEDLQKKMFEKKKFVIDTDYVITLDKIVEYCGKTFLEENAEVILENKEQLEEWKDYFSLEELEKVKDLQYKDNESGKKSYKKLPLDTRYFDSNFKYNLLSSIKDKYNLDDILDGNLIHSENWQAMNTIQEKYKESIKCCYIDPPYNTGNDGFPYKDSYQHSSWLSMMNDRLDLSKKFISKKGLFFSSIDDNEFGNLRRILDNVFRSENRLDRGSIIWNNAGSTKGFKKIVKNHEYILAYGIQSSDIQSVYGKNYPEEMEVIDERLYIKRAKKNPPCTIYFPEGIEIEKKDNIIFQDKIGKGKNRLNIIEGKMVFENGKLKKGVHLEGSFPNKNQLIRFLKGKEVCDTKGQKWLKVYFNKNGKPYYKKRRKYEILDSVQKNISNAGSNDLKKLGLKDSFDYPKPIDLVGQLLKYFVLKNDNEIVLDFFSGSGTTQHAVMKLNKEDGGNRKFLGIEMGEHFNTVLLPRIKKVLYSLDWKKGEPNQKMDSIGGFFKYQSLEQYEDTLNNIEFDKTKNNTLFDNKNNIDNKNIIKYCFEKSKNDTGLSVEDFKKPFDYKLNISNSYNEFESKKIDLVETFNYLLGIKVNSIQKQINEEQNNKKYIFVKGKKDNGSKTLIVWRTVDQDFDKECDKEFINDIVNTEEYDDIYINTDSVVKVATPIASNFQKLMFNNNQ